MKHPKPRPRFIEWATRSINRGRGRTGSLRGLGFIMLFCIFCLIYPFAVIGVAFNVQPPFSLHWAGSVLLFLEGTLLILAAALAYGPLPALIISTLVFVLSYLIEAIGVTTGIPFGLYHYTDILFLHLPGGVPLAVMFAWILIVFGSYAWVHTDTHRLNSKAALLGAMLATLLDLAIEPIAAHIVDYWRWSPPGPVNYYGVPFANFIAWFLVTFALLLLTGRFLVTTGAGNRVHAATLFVPRFLFGASLFMFGLVDLTHGYYVATLMAIFAGCLLLVKRTRYSINPVFI
jgi:uncharacterized membrane protein